MAEINIWFVIVNLEKLNGSQKSLIMGSGKNNGLGLFNWTRVRNGPTVGWAQQRHPDCRSYSRISKDEVSDVLRKTKVNKAVEKDHISMEI